MRNLIYAIFGFLAGFLLGFLAWGLPNDVAGQRQENSISIDRPEISCGVNRFKFEGNWTYRWRGNTYVKFIINNREPEVFYGNHEWWTGVLTLAPDDYVIRAELWGEWQNNWTLKASQDGRFTIDECEPEPTTRMCHWNGDGFDAIAVTETARTRHFNAHELDRDWEEGMDAQCEFPPDPEPEPTPDPEPVVRETGPAGAPPVCTGADLGDWAPTIYEVGRIDSDTVFARWTESTDNADDYILWYGLTADNLEWNVKVENSEYAEVDLPDHPNVHVWFSVQATDNCVVGELSEAIDP